MDKLQELELLKKQQTVSERWKEPNLKSSFLLQQRSRAPHSFQNSAVPGVKDSAYDGHATVASRLRITFKVTELKLAATTLRCRATIKSANKHL